MKTTLKNVILGAALVSTASANAATWKAGDTDVSLKGYVKLDWAHVDGAGSNASLNRQLTVPSTITEDSAGGRNGFQVFQTRFGLGTATDTKLGKAKSYIEMDYYLSSAGNEVISNSYNPRLRHAFFSVGKWTFGQTWSTFMFLPSLNEQLDFGGYAGTNFVRQAMIKYTTSFGAWTLDAALENAETTAGTGADSTVDDASTTANEATTVASDNDAMPDIVAKLTHKGNYGTFGVSAMYRKHNSEEVGKDDTSFALSAGAKVNYMGKSNLRFAVGHGNLGRYGSFTAFKDAVVVSDNKIEATEALQWHAGVQQYLTDSIRMNLDYGVGTMDTFTSGQIEEVSMIHANIIRQVLPNFHYGVEWSQTNITRFGSTKDADKADEITGNRYMFSAQYSF